MNWRPGDRAIFVGTSAPEALGTEVTVMTFPMLWENGREYVITRPLIRSVNGVYTSNLRPIDDYDGHEITSWSKCVWQPKGLVTL